MGIFFGTFQKLAGSVAVWFLRQKNIGTFLESVGVTLDGALEQLDQGMKLTRPLDCDSSALPVIAHDRTMALYPTEPEAALRQRLTQWLPVHRSRGTHFGEMRELQRYFTPHTPVIRIVHQDGNGASATWHTLAADGTYSVHVAAPSNWDWDGAVAKWSRFWVIIYTNTLNLPAQPDWGGGQNWDGGDTVWDGLLTADQIADLVNIVQGPPGDPDLGMKAAHSMLYGIIFATDANSFDPSSSATTDPSGWTSLPTGNWAWCIDNSTGKPSRLPTAVFAYDRGPISP